MTAHLLDRPVWNALSTRQLAVSVGDDRARRFAPDIGPLSGTRDEQLTAGAQTYAIPAGRRTTIRLKVPAGAVGFGLQPSWSGGTPPQAPSLLAARLADTAGTTDLLY